MANGYKTFADVFDPVQTMVQAQQLKNMQQQAAAQKIKNAQLQQQAQKDQAFQQYISGQQQQPVAPIPQAMPGQPPIAPAGIQPQAAPPPVQQQAPPPPPPTPEQIQVMRGKHKLKPVMASAQRNVASPNANKINAMAQRDPDVQAAIKSMGFDSVEIGYDEAKQKAWQRYTKTWSKDELTKLSQQPGGQVLQGLPEGKYTVEIDPITKTIRPVVSKEAMQANIGDKDLTENQIIAAAMGGNKQAIKWMDAKIAFERRKTGAKVGELTPEAINLMADQVLISPNYLSKFSARGPQRAQIVNKLEEKVAKNDLLMPDVTMQRVKYNAAVKSYNRQKLGYDADQKIADEFYVDLARLKPQIAAIRTNYPALVNRSIKQIRKMAATPSLGQEAVFAQELDAVLSAFIRVSRDASASISEMSATTQEAVKKLVNPESPAFVLAQQIDMFERSMRQRMVARRTALDRQLGQIRKSATFGKQTPQNKFQVGGFTVEVE